MCMQVPAQLRAEFRAAFNMFYDTDLLHDVNDITMADCCQIASPHFMWHHPNLQTQQSYSYLQYSMQVQLKQKAISQQEHGATFAFPQTCCIRSHTGIARISQSFQLSRYYLRRDKMIVINSRGCVPLCVGHPSKPSVSLIHCHLV